MKSILNLFPILVLISFSLLISSCGDEDECTTTCPAGQVLTAVCTCVETNVVNCAGITCPAGQILTADCDCIDEVVETEVIVTTNVTENTTWTADKCWILGGRIAVTSGATLTIEPGTIIKGQAGAEENATALVVARGGKIMAEGTAAAPIIFTSIADEIQSGEVKSPNLDPNINGLWGGVIVLGNAPISADAVSVQIEGIPPSDQNGLYGGTDAADNSGVMTYVSIRHGGTDIGEGNEINGLTLGGVGTGTVIDHVEVVSNVDDGIEFFGGSVNCTNLIVYNQGDDAFDADQAYTGTVDNFVGIAGPESDHSLEFDGPEGAGTGTYTFRNGSLKGWNDGGTDGGEYADMRDDVTCNIENCYFFNYSENSDFELDGDPESINYTEGSIVFTGLQFNTSHLTDGKLLVSDIFVDKGSLDAFSTKPADATNVSSGTVGATITEFASWTMVDAEGLLTGF